MSLCLKAHHLLFEMFNAIKMGLALTQKFKLASVFQQVSPFIEHQLSACLKFSRRVLSLKAV